MVPDDLKTTEYEVIQACDLTTDTRKLISTLLIPLLGSGYVLPSLQSPDLVVSQWFEMQ